MSASRRRCWTRCSTSSPPATSSPIASTARRPARSPIPPALWAQAKRLAGEGVRMDIGHGAASFDFGIARRAIGDGLKPWSISTDLHLRNIDGPVYDLALTASKLLAVGLSLDDCVAGADRPSAQRAGPVGRRRADPRHAGRFHRVRSGRGRPRRGRQPRRPPAARPAAGAADDGDRRRSGAGRAAGADEPAPILSRRRAARRLPRPRAAR